MELSFKGKAMAWIVSVTLVVGLCPGFAFAAQDDTLVAGSGIALTEQAVGPIDYSGDAVTTIKDDGSAFGMFTPQEGTEAVVSDDSVSIKYYPKNKTIYKGFYLNADIADQTTWVDANFVEFDAEGNFTLTLDKANCGKALPIAPVKKSDGGTTSSQYYLAIPAADKLPTDADVAKRVDELIAAIQVQYRTPKTDEQCKAAKDAWDALTDKQKALVEEYDYFGLDTGDASKDDPLNADNIGEKEILVTSFGTSFNDSRVATIGGVEKALKAAFPEWSVRRAFTAQIIINHIQARDNEKIDNMDQALERAAANGVKNLVIAPTHLMHGAEYDELIAAVEPYQSKMTITVSEPLLGEVGADPTVINDDKTAVAKAVVAAACEDAGYADAAAAATDKAAIVLMGHGTAHEAKVTYEQMQTAMNQLGYGNVFVGTVEGEPETTACPEIINAVKAAGYTKVFLRPLMVVAGDHANNDMADPEDPESWYSQFTASGAFSSVTCQIKGLGEIPAVQQLYVKHVNDVLSGDFELAINNTTAMFKAASASAKLNADGSATLTMALSGTGYHYLYKGTYEEAVANGDDTSKWIAGKENAAGKWEFVIPITQAEMGANVPIVAISNTYYEKYKKGENPLARAFFPRQINLNLVKTLLTTGDYEGVKAIKATKLDKVMFAVLEDGSTLTTVGGPNSNNYAATLNLAMKNETFDKAFLGSAEDAEKAEKAGEASVIPFNAENKTFAMKVKWIVKAGDPESVVTYADGTPFIAAFHSKAKDAWYERVFVLDEKQGTLEFCDASPARLADDLISDIQVQYRTPKTDEQCKGAKDFYDGLLDPQKAVMEEADYFGLDTGDASKDDPLNADKIGENEILVTSFGTSFNDSRVATIGGVEKALQAAYPNWSVRRAFTAQIIINHIQARDNEVIDNMDQALERAVANGVKNLVVQPTHLMHGAEYDELVAALEPYKTKMNIVIAEPLLGEVGADPTVINDDKIAVAKAVVAAAAKDAGYADAAAAAKDGAAIVLMGHGTAHEAKVTYEQMQTAMNQLGYGNVFVGTVEGEPESTACPEIIKAVKAAGYTKVFLRPLMVVAGDHANNDMADPEDPESWYSQFTASGAFDSVTCQIKGLGEIPAVQQLYVDHTAAVIPAIKVDVPMPRIGMIYTGAAQTGVDAGTGYTLSGTTSATNAGEYKATAKLVKGYVWADGSTADKVISWSISPARIDTATVTLKKTSSTYTGKAQQGAVKSVVLSGKTLKSSDYTVSAKKGKNVGSYPVTVKGKGNYAGTAKATFKITKANATAKVISKKTYKAANLKKKAATFTAIKLTTDGKATYKVTKNSNKKYISFKAGKVTVKKGTTKGKYTLKVKASAKAGKNYKAMKAKTYAITITVK